MASSREYLQYILEQLSDLEDISYRPMMGEFIIYYRGKAAGGIYDNRLLIKPVASAVSFIREPIYEAPYPGGKDMLSVPQIDDRAFIAELFRTMYDELPAQKAKS